MSTADRVRGLARRHQMRVGPQREAGIMVAETFTESLDALACVDSQAEHLTLVKAAASSGVHQRPIPLRHSRPHYPDPIGSPRLDLARVESWSLRRPCAARVGTDESIFHRGRENRRDVREDPAPVRGGR